MDTLLKRYSVPMETFVFDQGSISNYSYPDHGNGFEVNHELINPLFLPTNLDLLSDSSTSLKPTSDRNGGDISDYNNPVLKYISDILLEEDIEDKPCMLQDCLALQAAEKSFYDVLNPKDATVLNQSFENSDDYRESCDSNGGSIFGKTYGVADPSESCHFQSSLVECLSDTSLVSDSSSKLQSPGNFGRVEEANKFHENFEVIDAERYQLMLQGPQTLIGSNLVSEQQSDRYNSANRSEAKKIRQRQDAHCLEEWRSNKQSVAYFTDDSEPQEMFDKALLFQGVNHEAECSAHHDSFNEGSGQCKVSKPARSKRQNKKEKVVDLCTMLTQCAQAVASYDQRNASELLKQIRQHSSPYGDATQRLAHYFADGLEVRLAGTRTPSYSPIASMQISTVEILKSYQTYVTSTPLKTVPHFFANMTIMKLAEKATSLHIIDFGTSYGFQWPSLIQCLSERHGGPPKLRITTIELPQPGFRPTERVEETGRRLAKYSARFSVPFEFHVIAQKWETVGFDDLKIDRNELIVVNCLHRLKHVPDVTMMGNSPRDAVLKLIKKINPEIFIHGVVNGAYNSPFFLTRFKQALFHYDALFNVFEATIPCEDQQRLFFERAGYGRDIMNVVACEGLEIVERPETYKKWQVRNVRAGFKQLPLDQELLKKVKTMSKSMGYHNDFSIDEDEQWMLQGWKGRVLMALSFWKRE
ncbi:putative transcription factor GRAS family [Rosa chinensis]|uniref:Putative transcription factor GRAS family n=2 Tax=Rosa chinensis TaxID=74649 RepID=A0A2P6QIZ0_ROSCH|nr:scarecrow-like protein 33 isoform X1 [Rosa chinensis]PRQ34145.1 putative transcription factor GRAS family [Rosa chinensis]